jgi:hypothetical protein
MREYRKRRAANGDKPLGYFTGKKPDHRTPEEIATAEAERKARLKAYHAKWYQDNKERMKAEEAAKLAAMSPAEHEERKRKRREYEGGYRDKNRTQVNAKSQKHRDKLRAQKTASAQ